MWLLNVETRLLESFLDDRTACGTYAILSHTWGNEEVKFDEIHSEEARSKEGYKKIEYTCRQAVHDSLRYVWIDTCCIDKRSSAELSEAINSMYRWYYDAAVCYVFLQDLRTLNHHLSRLPHERGIQDSILLRQMTSCRWFTRGWTLQELIAPHYIKFYNADWAYVGSKVDLSTYLSSITRIDEAILKDRKLLRTTNVAKKMSWAAGRKTTREEDIAYSLLGLFDVNMPLLYGEGRKAFMRLQEEIIRSWQLSDHSILTWNSSLSSRSTLFACSPDDFDNMGNIQSWALPTDGTFQLSSQGLRISTYGVLNNDNEGLLAILNCRQHNRRLALTLRGRSSVLQLSKDKDIEKRANVIYDVVERYIEPAKNVGRSLPGRSGLKRLVLLDEITVEKAINMEITIARDAINLEPLHVRYVKLYVSPPLRRSNEVCPHIHFAGYDEPFDIFLVALQRANRSGPPYDHTADITLELPPSALSRNQQVMRFSLGLGLIPDSTQLHSLATFTPLTPATKGSSCISSLEVVGGDGIATLDNRIVLRYEFISVANEFIWKVEVRSCEYEEWIGSGFPNRPS